MKNVCNINCENGQCNGVINAAYDIDQLEIQIRTLSNWYDIQLKVTSTDGVDHIISPTMTISNAYYFHVPLDCYKNAGTMTLYAFGKKDTLIVDVVDDERGNLSVSSDYIAVSDDGNGNATITSEHIYELDEGNLFINIYAPTDVETSPYQFIVNEPITEKYIVEFIDGLYYINNTLPVGTHVILISPSGIEYKVMVNDAGELYTERKGE